LPSVRKRYTSLGGNLGLKLFCFRGAPTWQAVWRITQKA
jgi:hypothetical protein